MIRLDGLVQAISELAKHIQTLQQQQSSLDSALAGTQQALLALDNRLAMLESWLSDPVESPPLKPRRFPRH